MDLDAPVLVVVPSIFGVRAEASSSGHALGVNAILENTLVQEHGLDNGLAIQNTTCSSC